MRSGPPDDCGLRPGWNNRLKPRSTDYGTSAGACAAGKKTPRRRERQDVNERSTSRRREEETAAGLQYDTATGLPEKKSVGRGMRETAAPDRIVWRSFFYD